MGTPSPYHEDYDTSKSIATFLRLSQVAVGTLVQTHSWHAVKRLIEVNSDEEVEAASDDPLAEMLVEGAEALRHTEPSGAGEYDIEPTASLAALFDGNSNVAKSLKPKLHLAYDLRTDASICGFCSACDWSVDESLGTSRFVASYLREHKLPHFDSSWVLIDVIASSKPMTGALLCLQVYLAAKAKSGVVAIAVTKGGKSLFSKLGFESHPFREEGGHKALMYAPAGSLSMATINRRLKFAGDKELLSSICWRFGLTPKTSGSLVRRCT